MSLFNSKNFSFTCILYMYMYIQTAEEGKEEGAPDLPTTNTQSDVALEDEEEEEEGVGEATRTLLAYTSE